MYKVYFFDFDGVILDSTEVKTLAFRKLFLPLGEGIAEKMVNYHVAHGGISRYEKVRYAFRTFLSREATEQEVEEFGQKFSDLVLEGVLSAPKVNGIESFLEKSLKEDVRMWVISGTPQEELRFICKKLNFEKYFVDIFGSPKSKSQIGEEIINEHNISDRSLITFFGDAMTDYNAAKNLKTKFVLREHSENQDQFSKFNIKKIDDFREFL